MNFKKMRPIIKSDWWRIGPSPDLSKVLPTPEKGVKTHEMVDHHVFQDDNGKWHLWGCIRACSVERILYHWQSDDIICNNWECTGEMLRPDRKYGECCNDGNSEQIQSPFIVKHDGRFYMLFGGVEVEEGAWTETETELAATFRVAQICLMTSDDGLNWDRHKNDKGQSRVFVGPGAARDPSLIKIEDLWHCYYAGFHEGDSLNAGVYLRTSKDLMNWSDWKLVHYDEHFHHHKYMAECPTVIKNGEWYYLFITENYYKARSYVFASKDPNDFGVFDGRDDYDVNDYFVGVIKTAAPEIITDKDGNQYITSNHDLTGGTLMAKLGWAEIK